MRRNSCAFDESGHSGETKRRITILPESLHLLPGDVDIPIEEIRSLVSISFCEKHWEVCKDLVLTEDENIIPKLQTRSPVQAPAISYISKDSYHASSPGELESERQKLIRKSLSRNPRENPSRRRLVGKVEEMDDIWERGDVERKITKWTLKELPPEKCGKTERLKHDLKDLIEDSGLAAQRILEPEADIEVHHRGRNYYFQVRWLSEGSEEVSPVRRIYHGSNDKMQYIWEKSMPSDSYFAPNRPTYGESLLRNFAHGRDGVPILAIRWGEDENWYFLYQTISDFGEYITVDKIGWVPVRVHDEFTPLPTLDDLEDLFTEEKSWRETIDQKLEDFYSEQSSLHRLKMWYLRFRDPRLKPRKGF